MLYAYVESEYQLLTAMMMTATFNLGIHNALALSARMCECVVKKQPKEKIQIERMKKKHDGLRPCLRYKMYFNRKNLCCVPVNAKYGVLIKSIEGRKRQNETPKITTAINDCFYVQNLLVSMEKWINDSLSFVQLRMNLSKWYRT